MKPKILIIAGLDPSGHAGLLRDLDVVRWMGLRASCVATALTAQDKEVFFSSNIVSPLVFKRQLESVLPLSQYGAVKVGMLGNETLVRLLVGFLKKEKKRPPVILDPVCYSTTGGLLLTKGGQKALFRRLVPLVSLWTPNRDEAELFSGRLLRSREEVERAGELFVKKKGVPVLIKGFFSKNKVYDLFVDRGRKIWFSSLKRRPWIRGSGCALSSLVASYLASGERMARALQQARKKIR